MKSNYEIYSLDEEAQNWTTMDFNSIITLLQERVFPRGIYDEQIYAQTESTHASSDYSDFFSDDDEFNDQYCEDSDFEY